MAKDKSKTKDKGAKPGKDKGGNGAFAKPSDAPAPAEGWRLETEDNLGSLFLITPLREQDFKSDKYGESVIIVADVVEVNLKNPAKSEAHDEVYIFGAWVKGSLRGYIGERKVLGRLGKGDAVKGKSEPWILEDASDKDYTAATAYLEQVDVFKTKSKDKSKSKGK